jgi:hypothetical protein
VALRLVILPRKIVIREELFQLQSKFSVGGATTEDEIEDLY